MTAQGNALGTQCHQYLLQAVGLPQFLLQAYSLRIILAKYHTGNSTRSRFFISHHEE